MDKSDKYETAISDFTAFMYQKGYRAKFALDQIGTDRIFFSANLSACLRQYFQLHKNNTARSSFELVTSPPYEPKISCRLDLVYNAVKGFLIKAIRIEDQASGQSRHYRTAHNHQLPGAATLSALFPKKKPWEDFLKGKKFRP